MGTRDTSPRVRAQVHSVSDKLVNLKLAAALTDRRLFGAALARFYLVTPPPPALRPPVRTRAPPWHRLAMVPAQCTCDVLHTRYASYAAAFACVHAAP